MATKGVDVSHVKKSIGIRFRKKVLGTYRDYRRALVTVEGSIGRTIK